MATARCNNCAHGITPWGTFLSCEENLNGNFGATRRCQAAASETGKLNHRYGISRRRLRLSLAHDGHALGPEREPERGEPLRLGGRDRPVRPEVQAGEAHGAGPLQARERAVRSRRRTTASPSTWATTSATSTSTSSSAGDPQHEERRTPTETCSTRGTLYVARLNADLAGQVDSAVAGHDRRGRRRVA